MKYTPIILLFGLSLFTSCSSAQAFDESIESKPNVLFIALDDLNDWIGCMGGHPQTITPNLDRLAASGVLFTNAHCAAPACNPSRSAIFTGRAPNQSGLYDNRQRMREVMPNEVILPQYFRNHGYKALGSGKMLHYFIDAASWDSYFPNADSENPLPQTFYPTNRPVNLPRGGPWQYVETDWAQLPVSDEEFGGDWSVSQWVGKQLAKSHEIPFFLACGIYRPHEPWFVPEKYFAPFPIDEVKLPPGYLEDDLSDVPEVGVRAARNRYFAHIQKQDQWRQGVQAYLASIHFADAMLGRVLDALEAGPNKDNTIVVLWSDHGWQLGEKEHWQKYTPWRAVTRVPLMLRVPPSISSDLPSGTSAGQICQDPVNLLSLYPTLLDLCGLPAKKDNDGPSILPLLTTPESQPKFSNRNDANAQPSESTWAHDSITYLSKPGSFAISGRTHRYIHYFDGSEELYDIEKDPYEWKNLAKLPASRELMRKFRERSPTEFAPRLEPSVESLAKLTFIPASVQAAPPSKPDGNPFQVFFTNKSRDAVELCWMDRTGKPKSYGLIETNARRQQQTRPGAVWMVRNPKNQKEIGHFVIGDRTAQAVIPETQPNVVIILTDDQGWADLGVQGQRDDISTPHIDALANRGVQCSAAYVTAPQCSPSRAALLTGIYQQRFAIDTIPDMPLPTEAVTLAEHLKPLGYQTGFVGKWHLEPNVLCQAWMQEELPEMFGKPRRQIRIPWPKMQPYSPSAQGFDQYFWGERQVYRTNFPTKIGQPTSMRTVTVKNYRIEAQTNAACEFIDRNRDRPFYLQLNYYGPHTPLETTPKYLERFEGPMPQRRRYALAMLSAIDDGVGRIVNQLKEIEQLDNTLIVFTSDNGAPLKMTKPDSPVSGDPGGWDGSLNDPWIGEKGMLSEGGIRVPMIWSLPSQLPTGRKYDWPVSTLDIVPSVLRMAGGNTSDQAESFDGIDLFPRFNSIQIPSTRTLYFRFWDQAALRKGKWKYVFVSGGERYLFDLESDQHEKENLLSIHPHLANTLHESLVQWTEGLNPPGLPLGKKQRERRWYQFYFNAP